MDDRIRKVVEGVTRRVEKHGWTAIHVGDSDELPPFAYTVGLTLKGHPELLVTGLPMDVGQGILAVAARRVLDGEELSGPVEGLIRGYVAQCIEVDVERVETKLANRLYGDRVRVRIISWPDADGRFPWDREAAGYLAEMQPYAVGPTPAPGDSDLG